MCQWNPPAPGLLFDLLQIVDLAHRRTGRLALLGHRLEDRLADPPDRVGDELEAAGLVETTHSLQ